MSGHRYRPEVEILSVADTGRRLRLLGDYEVCWQVIERGPIGSEEARRLQPILSAEVFFFQFRLSRDPKILSKSARSGCPSAIT
jgi:hypothetical protein